MVVKPIFFDTETCGLHSVPVTIQWCVGVNGEIKTWHFWKNDVQANLDLLDMIINHPDGVVAFNLAFDWFHVAKFYTMLDWLKKNGHTGILSHMAGTCEGIEILLEAEERGSWGPCVKPHRALDLFLHARKTHYQSTMERKDIVIKRVPTPLARPLCRELESRIPLKNIYFARKTPLGYEQVKHKDGTVTNEPVFQKWQVFDIKDVDGNIDPDFKNVRLIFAPSSALKALAVDALDVPSEQVLRYADVGAANHPFELAFAPKANLIIKHFQHHLVQKMWKKKKKWYEDAPYHGTWPAYILDHVNHWFTDPEAKKYAQDDVIYTRRLYDEAFRDENGPPAMDDDDSVLATTVACCRWRGHRINLEGIKKLRKTAEDKLYVLDENGKRLRPIPIAPKAVKEYIMPHLSELDKVILSRDPMLDITKSTKKVVLERLSKRTRPCSCVGFETPQCKKCKGKGSIMKVQLDDKGKDKGLSIMAPCDCTTRAKQGCPECKGSGTVMDPVSVPAKQVLEARKVGKELELLDKLIIAERLYANYKVIGALSSRMSGDGKFNVQGIKKAKYVRENFELADSIDMGETNNDGTAVDEELDGGDFEGFEVTIADAIYGDLNMRRDLLTCEKCDAEMIINPQVNSYVCQSCGSNKAKKIHAFFGTCVYPDMTYEDIKATDGTARDIYTDSKRGVFALMYGGTFVTLMDRLGVPLEHAQAAVHRWEMRYPGVGRARMRIQNSFGSMRQPGGIGTKVIWKEPVESAQTLVGFRRYYHLENQICRALFDLANKIPGPWRQLEGKVKRRDREQTLGGAASSALYACAFAIQSSNIRTAGNHEIQGTGSQITKRVQRRIWDYQPAGVSEWLVRPMNIHDEIECPVKKGHEKAVKKLVQDTVEEFRPMIPLILMKWKTGIANWAAK